MAGEGEKFACLRIAPARADSPVSGRVNFSLVGWSRASRRQQRTVPRDGVTGTLEAEGDLTELMPNFRAGEWLQVGRERAWRWGGMLFAEEVVRSVRR